jgi:hypothetical protein
VFLNQSLAWQGMAGVDAGLPDMTAGRGGKAATESALDAIEEVIKEGKVLMKDEVPPPWFVPTLTWFVSSLPTARRK